MESVFVRVEVPEEYYGKWVLTSEFGTHGSYEIMLIDGGGVMCFDSQEHAEAYRTFNNLGNYYQTIKISKEYPYCQIKFFICGMSTEKLIESSKNK